MSHYISFHSKGHLRDQGRAERRQSAAGATGAIAAPRARAAGRPAPRRSACGRSLWGPAPPLGAPALWARLSLL